MVMFGTGFMVKWNGVLYLVTALHVLWDKKTKRWWGDLVVRLREIIISHD